MSSLFTFSTVDAATLLLLARLLWPAWNTAGRISREADRLAVWRRNLGGGLFRGLGAGASGIGLVGQQLAAKKVAAGAAAPVAVRKHLVQSMRRRWCLRGGRRLGLGVRGNRMARSGAAAADGAWQPIERVQRELERRGVQKRHSQCDIQSLTERHWSIQKGSECLLTAWKQKAQPE